MSDLFEFSYNNPQYSPKEAVHRMVQSYQNGGQNSAQIAQAQYMMMGGMANASSQQGQAQIGVKPPMMINGGITPNMAAVGRNQEHLGAFASPAMSQIGLPGSLAMDGSPHLNAGAGPVHTPSPAQGHMQPPGLVNQQGQQGGGGAAAAAAAVAAAAGVTPGNTTSPNVTAKRRRQSTIKTEGDEGGDIGGGPGEANGVGPGGPSVGGASAKVKASPRTGGPAKRVKANAG